MGAPSLVEVEVVVYSLLVRWSWIGLDPSSVEVDCCCIASVEVVLVERGVRHSRLLYRSSLVEVPSVGVLGGLVSGLEILLGEGRDVELGARTSEHID